MSTQDHDLQQASSTDFSSRAEAIRSRLADACASESMLIFSDSVNAIVARYYREDLPDALAEIARLTAQVETLQGELVKEREAHIVYSDRANENIRLLTETKTPAEELRHLDRLAALMLPENEAMRVAEKSRADAAQTQVTALREENETLKAEHALACESSQFYVQRAADAKVLQHAAQAEVTALRALLEWRPIETAPKDGSTVELFSEGRWSSFYNNWEREDGRSVYNATHWRPKG